MTDKVQLGRGQQNIRAVMLVGLVAGLAPAVCYGAYAIALSGRSWLTSGYMVTLMGGWLATAMGVVIGLPVAAWVADRASASERRKRADEEERFAAEMRARTLRIVRHELASSLAGLTEMASGTLTRFHYNVGRWNALTSSGDLKWIQTLTVIDDLAEAYEALEVVNVLADGWLKSLDGSRPGETPDDRDLVRRLAAEAAGDAATAVEKALSTIDDELPVRDEVTDGRQISGTPGIGKVHVANPTAAEQR